jgi:hypothetical protein
MVGADPDTSWVAVLGRPTRPQAPTRAAQNNSDCRASLILVV